MYNIRSSLVSPILTDDQAIKFTQSENDRSKNIIVNLGASITKPPKAVASDIQWFPSKDSNKMQDLTLAPEWGTGEQVYLYLAVQDTGRGLSDEEQLRLFHRFSQASPRTHVQYGGSGLGECSHMNFREVNLLVFLFLGLFISRELTELQGGEIGVASTAGVGSKYINFFWGCTNHEKALLHSISKRGDR